MLKNKLLSAMGGAPANYIEDVFSTYLYTGNGSTQTITNGIDLAGKGGLVWRKLRSAAGDHILEDTVRGSGNYLLSNATNAQANSSTLITSFNTTGFTTGAGSNANGSTYASWTFRDQAKFFDVVTWTGNGANRTIAHNLGSAPGCMIVKRTDSTGNWHVWHRSFVTAGSTDYIYLNQDQPQAIGGALPLWDNTVPTTTVFSLSNRSEVNSNGGTYVAYLFAHNAGGFGLTGTDNVISCGSFTTDGSANATVNLGYEPQWVMWKSSTASDQWQISDTMRGWSNSSGGRVWLRANAADAETVGSNGFPTSTGFEARGLSASQTYIYIAIRRGPMKVPTDATKVFKPDYAWNTDPNILGYLGQPSDAFWLGYLGGNAVNVNTRTRLVGGNRLSTSSTNAEVTDSTSYWDSQLGFKSGGSRDTSLITWNWKRAPGFFDVVCYTGTGSATTFSHNLGVVPQLIIFKMRSATRAWPVYDATNGNSGYSVLSSDSAWAGPDASVFNNTSPTSSVFTVNTSTLVNGSGSTYVAYLFASCPGVSKVGSYTGNGSNQTINCGFTGGARFVMIKRTDSTGDWYVWDTARGIVSGNDPRLSLNSTAAEVTTDDSVDTDSTGFVVNQLSATNINVNAATYIFLAIA